ncbi:MAG TPA: DUF899 family protein [Fimbriimonas sp.]|nr:DUF899 family protein [Fimbriimonas sp.]
MDEISRTDAEYVAAISDVLAYIQTHLDDELTPQGLSHVACFSQHHFHRIFRAVVGESVMDHVRRLRMERAAYRLKTSRASIGSIAFDAGYAAQEAFTRMFQACFGVSPRTFRFAHAAHALPAPCGIHYGPRGFSPLRRATDPDLLRTDQLCPAHREWAGEFEEKWAELVEIVTGFASFVYPRRLLHLRNQQLEKFMSLATTDIDKEIEDLQHEIETAKQRLVEAQKRRPREEVSDYTLQTSEGKEIRLSELFGDKSDLILVHNMGTGCSYCTMWADGFTGLVPHLEDRAGFVLCSPDKPDVLKRFADKRHWNFKTVSAHESDFIKDMGFWQSEGAHPGPWPGVSTFHKDPDGKIYRIAKAHFGPGDDFCAVWPFLDMLQEGANGWEPQYFYGEKK